MRIPILALLLAPGLAHSACEAPTTNMSILATIEKGLEAFGEFEIEVFAESVADATGQLECLKEPISRATAAEVHRVRGLKQFTDRDAPSARRSFAAARAIEPNYTFPSDLVPEGNPALDAYSEMDPDGVKALVAVPKVGSIKLDGSSSLNRVQELPVVFQLIDGTGAVAQTVLVAGGANLPSYEIGRTAVEKPTKTNTKTKKDKTGTKKGPNAGLLVASGVSALAAGGLYGGAFVMRGSFEDARNVGDLESARNLNHILVIGSGVAGVTAVGLGTTSLLLSGSF